MTTPVTALDQRFSAPDAAATGWEETRRALEAAELFWISTVRADGRPHVTPLVAVWADGAIHFCTGPTEQKAGNLSANPHVILTTGCNSWDAGLDVVVEGVAVRVTDDDVLKRLAAAWAAKWDGRWQFHVRDGCFYHSDPGVSDPGQQIRYREHEVRQDAVLVFSVTPSQIAAHDKGDPFGHTRHRF
jgi:general stress protein 26